MTCLPVIRRLGVALLLSSGAGAQSAPPRMHLDFTAARGSTLTTFSAGAVGMTVPILGHFRFGLGVRGTYAGGDLKLTPAGARNVPVGVVDTLSLTSSALLFNVSGHVSALLTDRFEVGMNIDLLGLGAGASRSGMYRLSAGASPISVEATPASVNLFLYGSNDRGSLNSEFFGVWHATRRVAIRAGLSHQLVEYKTSRLLSSNTDRFRRYSNLGVVGVRVGR